ncbi:MAG TPA: hypothetical protein VNL16_05995 [Chloroflexota bacterium]|nr:hypothetical protein [Chloroflexota bacterium]
MAKQCSRFRWLGFATACVFVVTACAASVAAHPTVSASRPAPTSGATEVRTTVPTATLPPSAGPTIGPTATVPPTIVPSATVAFPTATVAVVTTPSPVEPVPTSVRERGSAGNQSGSTVSLRFAHLWLTDAQHGWLTGVSCQQPLTPPRRAGAAPPPQPLCQGVIEGTNDGGQIWHEAYRGEVQVGQIQFVGFQAGWAIGEKGATCPDLSCPNVLLQTTDRGAHWTEAYTTRLTDPTVAFTSPTAGWLLGQSCGGNLPTGCVGHLLATTDGGQTWHEVTLPERSPALAFAHPTAADGWLAVSHDRASAAHLLVTHDGGRTWRTLPEPAGNLGFAQTLFFRTPSDGWLLAAGQPAAGSQQKQVYQTTDGGVSWTKRAASAAWGQAGSKDQGIPTGGYVGPMLFTTDQDGWIASPRGSLLHSTDAGQTWQPATISSNSFSDVSFASPSVGWALSGEGPGLWATGDGGKSWRELREPLAP